MARTLTPRGEERRSQLMATAAELFAERGFHPTSVSDIVEAIGVGKGVFYWYFPSKEDLLDELLRAAQHDLRRRQQLAIEPVADPIERIELGIGASLQWFQEHRQYFTLFRFAASNERFAPTLQQSHALAIADTARHIQAAIAEGRCVERNPEMLAEAIVGVVEQLTQSQLMEREGSVDAVCDLAVAFCLRGLRG
ncbi:MAG: TetR/AcrR family transcriptional regulator [Acidimicrobiia bacterium]